MRKFFLLSLSFFLFLASALQPSSVTVNASSKPNESKPPESAQFKRHPFAIEAPETPPPPELPDNIRIQPLGNTDPAEQRVYTPPTEQHIAQTKIEVEEFDCSAVVLEVSYEDCSALEALYSFTTGTGWKYSTNWLTATKVDTWYGVQVSGERVKELTLQSNQLNGFIDVIGNLTELTHLNLSDNQLLIFDLSSLGGLTKLIQLDLSHNLLSGEIPTVLGDLTSLKGLNLSGNQLSGPIPASMGDLILVEYFLLNNNQLTGSIPLELGNLKNLVYLYLDHNQLSGSIPTELGTLLTMQDLILNDNQLSGEIPSSLGSLSSLKGLWLQSNQLSGAIPNDLGSLSNMYSLKLNNNMLEGEVPSGFTDLPQLCGADNTAYPCSSGVHDLDLGYNQLAVPATVPGVAEFLENKDPDWYLTQAVKETVSVDTGGIITSNNGNTEIVIPAGALIGDTDFLFAPRSSPSQSIGGLNFAGNSFQLNAWTGDPPAPVTSFVSPLLVTLHYDEANLGAIPENNLKLYYWDLLSTSWQDAASTCPGGAYTRNLTDDWLSLPICHLSEFALMGMPHFDIFMPLIKR